MIGKLAGWPAGRTARSRRAGLVAALAVLTLGVSACGGNTGGSGGAPSPQDSAPASGQAPGQASVRLMTATSNKSFEATTAALRQSVTRAGSMVLGEINQAEILSQRTGLQIEGAHAFLVGNPTMGKQVFQTDRAIGVVVPPRIYVWQTQTGTTKIGYLDPAPLFTSINPKLADAGKKMTEKFNEIVQGAAGNAPSPG